MRQRREGTENMEIDGPDTPTTGHGAWIDYIRRSIMACIFLGVALWGLHQQRFIHALLWDKRTNSTALNLALLSGTVVVLLWGYLDVYVGAVQRKKIRYNDTRTVTHIILICIMLCGLLLHVALWPVYHGMTPLLVLMLSYGVLFQIIILCPTWLYNAIFFALYSAFVYYYTGNI